MVKIRLTRMGDHKSPFYRIIVADSRSPRDGRFIEVLGTYDPHLDDGLKLDADKAKKWIANRSRASRKSGCIGNQKIHAKDQGR